MTKTLLLAMAILLTACGQPEDDVGQEDGALVGFVNYTSPEIGVITARDSLNQYGSRCTGTAVAPNVVLTAGHCVGPGNFFWTIEEPFTVRRFTVRGKWEHSAEDIGLLWLNQAVPFSRQVEETGPVGATVAIWGFGGEDCDHDGVNNGSGVKRVGFFVTQANGDENPVGTHPITCPGDSGGPVVDLNNGFIFGVHTSGPGTRNIGVGHFTANNRPGVWASLEFLIFVWQATSSSGG